MSETITLSSGQTITVHDKGTCLGPACTIHSPSDHHMKDWPQLYRFDRSLMERTCPHGVGHPDPDEINPDTMHGCDGCCVDWLEEPIPVPHPLKGEIE